MSVKRSPGCNCCGGISGCQDFVAPFTTGSVASEYAEWDIYGSGWDALTTGEKETHVANRTLPPDAGVVTKASVLADPLRWTVEWSVDTQGTPYHPYRSGFRYFYQADGADSDNYYYLDIRDNTPLPLYSPDYTGMGQDWEQTSVNYVSGIRSGGVETDLDTGYPLGNTFLPDFTNRPIPFPYQAARQQQPTGAYISGPTSLGHPILSDTELDPNNAGVVDVAGTLLPFLPNGGFPASVGDLFVYRGSTQETRLDDAYYELIPQASIPANEDVLTFAVASAHKISGPSEDLSGGKVGIYNGTTSTITLPYQASGSRSISLEPDTYSCSNVQPTSYYCYEGDGERTLPVINYSSNNAVAEAIVDNYLLTYPNDRTLHVLGTENSRSGVNEYRVMRGYLHSSKQDVFTQNGTEYQLRASYIWEYVVVKLGEAKGLATFVTNPSSFRPSVLYNQGNTTHATDADRTTYLNSLISNWIEYSWNYTFGDWSTIPVFVAESITIPIAAAPDRSTYSCSSGGWTLTGDYDLDLTSGNPLPVNPVIGLPWAIMV